MNTECFKVTELMKTEYDELKKKLKIQANCCTTVKMDLEVEAQLIYNVIYIAVSLYLEINGEP